LLYIKAKIHTTVGDVLHGLHALATTHRAASNFTSHRAGITFHVRLTGEVAAAPTSLHFYSSTGEKRVV
jgi:hypothetical protein